MYIVESVPGNAHRSHAVVVWVCKTLALFYMFFINVNLEGQKAKIARYSQFSFNFNVTLTFTFS